jgi:parallel beta-helix repeat protein
MKMAKMLLLTLLLLGSQMMVGNATVIQNDLDNIEDYTILDNYVQNNYATHRPNYIDFDRFSFERANIEIERDGSDRKIRPSLTEMSSGISILEEDDEEEAKKAKREKKSLPITLDIQSEQDLIDLGFPGNGTEEDPYVIAGLTFGAPLKNLNPNLLQISFTDVHILILNNTFTDANTNSFGIALFEVSNVVVDSNSFLYNSIAIFVEESKNVLIQDNSISDSSLDAMLIQDSESVSVEMNSITFNGAVGVNIAFSDSVNVISNEIENNGLDGIFIQDSNNNFIYGNTLRFNGYAGEEEITISTFGYVGSGIFVDPSFNNIIDSNVIENNAGEGILLELSDNNEIVNNIISGNEIFGIFVKDSNSNKITGNSISNNGNPEFIASMSKMSSIGLSTFGYVGSGIFVDPSYENIIDNNIIQSNAGSGVYLQLSSTNIVSNNQISDNDFDGIFLEDSNYNQIRGNKIHTNGFGVQRTISTMNFGLNTFGYVGSGIFVDPSVGNIIEDNEIFGNSANGIILEFSDDNLVSQNLLYDNGRDGITLIDSNANSIVKNHIFKNGFGNGDIGLSTFGYVGSGIFVDPSIDNLIDENIIYDNAAHGVFLELSSDNNITNNEIFSNNFEGVYIFGGEKNQLQGNKIAENKFNGVFIHDSSFNKIAFNAINKNGATLAEAGLGLSTFGYVGSGIFVDPSVGNIIEGNNVTENAEDGVFILDSNSTIVFDNRFIDNGQYGVNINFDSFLNDIFTNNFIGNHLNSLQARDDGSSNIFNNNFFDNIDNTDSNANGISDNPAEIDGEAGNFDFEPSNIPNGLNIIDFGDDAQIKPQSLNTRSKGIPLKVEITLTGGYRVLEVDPNNFYLNGSIQAIGVEFIDIYNFKLVFPRAEVNELINNMGKRAPFTVVLEVTGLMNDELLDLTIRGTVNIVMTNNKFIPFIFFAPIGIYPILSKLKKKEDEILTKDI